MSDDIQQVDKITIEVPKGAMFTAIATVKRCALLDCGASHPVVTIPFEWCRKVPKKIEPAKRKDSVWLRESPNIEHVVRESDGCGSVRLFNYNKWFSMDAVARIQRATYGEIEEVEHAGTDE